MTPHIDWERLLNPVKNRAHIHYYAVMCYNLTELSSAKRMNLSKFSVMTKEEQCYFYPIGDAVYWIDQRYSQLKYIKGQWQPIKTTRNYIRPY